MPAPVQSGAQEGGAPQGGGSIPFLVGSNLYREAPFLTVAQLLDGNSHETVVNITPGGFLRGIVLQITGAGGVIGAGVISSDGPFSVLGSVSIEDISGGPIIYPINGTAARVKQTYFTPWEGDPAKRPDFLNTVNPAFTLRLGIEVRDTLAVLANTDARAQYRLRFTLNPATNANPASGLFTTAPTTPPTITVKAYFETWAQPDLQDLLGNSIEGLPPGLVASRFVQHEIPLLSAGSNVIRHTLMGNEIRCLAWIFRTSAGARVDLTDANAGPIDFRIDSRRLWKMNPSQLVEEMNWFFSNLGNATWTRPTGVYIIPRFRDPDVDNYGEYWLQTVEQTLIQAELSGADVGANGTVEILYDQLAVAGTLSADIEGV